MPPTISIQETILADLVALLGTIVAGSGENDFRNTLALITKHAIPLDQMTAFPSAAVLFSDSSVEVINAAGDAFSEKFNVAIFGYVKSDSLNVMGANNELIDAANSLLHDIKKCIAPFIIAHMNDSTKRYIIARRQPAFNVFSTLPTPDRTKCEVGISFEVKTIAQDYTFKE